jgi:hypothetical protein
MNKIVRKSKGLGDTIHKITSATGIKKVADAISGDKPCSPCEARRRALNKAFPYDKK